LLHLTGQASTFEVLGLSCFATLTLNDERMPCLPVSGKQQFRGSSITYSERRTAGGVVFSLSLSLCVCVSAGAAGAAATATAAACWVRAAGAVCGGCGDDDDEKGQDWRGAPARTTKHPTGQGYLATEVPACCGRSAPATLPVRRSHHAAARTNLTQMRIERAGKSKTKDRSHVTEHRTLPCCALSAWKWRSGLHLQPDSWETEVSWEGGGKYLPYLIHNSGMSLVTIPTRRCFWRKLRVLPAVRATMPVAAQVLQQVPSQARDGRGASCWMERRCAWAGPGAPRPPVTNETCPRRCCCYSAHKH
jgi:hypothetical protein